MRCLSPQIVKDGNGNRLFDWYDMDTGERWSAFNKHLAPHPERLTPVGKEYPCGRCEACLRNKAAEWSFRLEVELKNSRGACYFITLTYDDEHLPRNSNGVPGFDKPQVQKFIKNLRNQVRGHPIKYYLAAEYGGQFHRPHYHMLLFDWPYSEQALGSINKRKLIGYVLPKVWPYGHVDIGDCTSASISYTSSYLITRMQIPAHWDPVFNLMSKGLGSQWLKNRNWYYESLCSSVRQNNKVVKTPRYFVKKLPLSQSQEFTKQRLLHFAEQLEVAHDRTISDAQHLERAQNLQEFVARTRRKFSKFHN